MVMGDSGIKVEKSNLASWAFLGGIDLRPLVSFQALTPIFLISFAIFSKMQHLIAEFGNLESGLVVHLL